MNYYTENLADFGARERKLAARLLSSEPDWPDAFDRSGVKLALNPYSGCVFLTNDDCQTILINAETDLPELWHLTPYEGREGFLTDLLDVDPSHYNADDIDYLLDAAHSEGIDLPKAWAEISTKELHNEHTD